MGFSNPVRTGGVCDVCLCCGGGESGCVVGVTEGGVISVCVVSLDYLCRWEVHVFVYCARWIPAHHRCTQC